jgi:hypothetical protein
MGRPEGRQEVKPTSLRFPVQIDALWTATAKKMNLPKSSVLILALQEYAERKGVALPEDKPEVTS